MLKKTVIALGLLVALPAQAHYIWMERDGTGTARIFFGEWQDELKEKTGGLLDRVVGPVAYTADPKAPLPVTRKADHIEVAATGTGDVRMVEAGYPMPAQATSKVVFYARAGRSETTGSLDLELVPAEAGGNAFTLMFRGKPLAKAKVEVFGPPRWSQALNTDPAGKVTISTPWAGQYVIEVAHVETHEGATSGPARTRHVSTLSFTTDRGIPWEQK